MCVCLCLCLCLRGGGGKRNVFDDCYGVTTVSRIDKSKVYRLFNRALLQKRPLILSNLLTKATPYRFISTDMGCVRVCVRVCVFVCVSERYGVTQHACAYV